MRYSKLIIALTLILIMVASNSPNAFGQSTASPADATVFFEGAYREVQNNVVIHGMSGFTLIPPAPPVGWMLFTFQVELYGLSVSQTELLAGNVMPVDGAHLVSFRYEAGESYAIFYRSSRSDAATIRNVSWNDITISSVVLLSIYFDVASMVSPQVDDSLLPIRRVYVDVPTDFITTYKALFNYRIGFRINWNGKAVPFHLYNPGGADLLSHRTDENAFYRYMRWGSTYARIYISRGSNGFAEQGIPVEGRWEIDLQMLDTTTPSLTAPVLAAFVDNMITIRQTFSLNPSESVTITLPVVDGWFRTYIDYLVTSSSDADPTLLVPSLGVRTSCNLDGRSCWYMYGDSLTLMNTAAQAATFSIEYQVTYYTSLPFTDQTYAGGSDWVQHSISFVLPPYSDYSSLGFDTARPYTDVRINTPLTDPGWWTSSFSTPPDPNGWSWNVDLPKFNNATIDLETGYTEGQTLSSQYLATGTMISYVYAVLHEAAAGLWQVMIYEPAAPVSHSSLADSVRERRFSTNGDTVSYDAPLTGAYAWSLWMDNIGSPGTMLRSPSISVLTQYPRETFSYIEPEATVTQVGAQYRYDWSVFADIPADGSGAEVYLESNMPTTFTPGIDSERIVTPLVISSNQAVQIVTVRVTPHEAFQRINVRIGADETDLSGGTYVPNSASPTPDGILASQVSWNYLGSYFQVGSTYEFSAQFLITNKAYPNAITNRPRVRVHGQSFLENSQNQGQGSSLTKTDDVLGQLTYAAAGTYTWDYLARERKVVIYTQQTTLFPPEGSTQVDVWASRELRFSTSEDQVPGDVPLDAYYVWMFDMSSRGPGALVSPVIQVQSSLPPSSFDRFSPTPTVLQEGSLYTYTWSYPGQTSPRLPQHFMGSNLHTTTSVGYDSSRSVNPDVLNAEVTDQILTVTVTPKQELQLMYIGVMFPEIPQASAQLISYYSSNGVEPETNVDWLGQMPNLWWAFPEVHAATVYTFQVTLRIMNKLYPTSIEYKPLVMIGGGPAIGPVPVTNEGSSISMADSVLGTISWSAEGSYVWSGYAGESAQVTYLPTPNNQPPQPQCPSGQYWDVYQQTCLPHTTPAPYPVGKVSRDASVTFEGTLNRHFESITLAPQQSWPFTFPTPPSGWLLNGAAAYLEIGNVNMDQVSLLSGSKLSVTGAHLTSFKFDPVGENYADWFLDAGSGSVTIKNTSSETLTIGYIDAYARYVDVKDVTSAEVHDIDPDTRVIFVDVPNGFVAQYLDFFNFRLGFQLRWKGKAVPLHVYTPGPDSFDVLQAYRNERNAARRFGFAFSYTSVRLQVANPAGTNGFYEIGVPVEGRWRFDFQVLSTNQPSRVGPDLLTSLTNEKVIRQTVELSAAGGPGDSATITPPTINGWYRQYQDYLVVASNTPGVDSTRLVPSSGARWSFAESAWYTWGDNLILKNTANQPASYTIEYDVFYFTPLPFSDIQTVSSAIIQHDLTFILPQYHELVAQGFDPSPRETYFTVNTPLTDPPWQFSSITLPGGGSADDPNLNNPSIEFLMGYVEGETLNTAYGVRTAGSDFVYAILGDNAAGAWRITVYEPATVLRFTLGSPAHLIVTDPVGRQVGYNVVSQVPGATYSGAGTEPEIVTIPKPLPGTYGVQLIGTTTGTYHLTTETAVAGNIVSQDRVTGSITTGEVVTSLVPIENPEGTPVISEAPPPQDVTPPTSTVNLQGTLGNNGWYTSDVQVTLSAIDNPGGLGVRNTQYSFDASNWITYSSPFSVGEGTTTLYYRSLDNVGNLEATKTHTIMVDHTLPSITITTPSNGGTYILNSAPVLIDYGCTDVGGSGVLSCTGPAPSNSLLDTSKVGPKTFTVQALDLAGNTASATATYTIKYGYGGILQPINPDGTSVFKLGSTVPVKFQLRDAGGKYVTTAIAKIYVAKISDGIIGTEMEASSTSAASTGNQFRYDPISNQYVFNWGTKGLTAGTWQIKITLDDGSIAYTINVSLKP